MQRPERRPRSIRIWLIIILALGLVGIVLYSMFSPSAPAPANNALLPEPTSTFRPGPTVIQAIQRQAKLETIAMSISSETTVKREHGLLGLCSEEITYLGYFNVTAGIDLNQLGSANIQATNDGFPDHASVTVTLPAPEVLHNELDTANSRLLSQDTPQWVPGCTHEIADMTLEAQQKLRGYADGAAREKGILRLAEVHAGEIVQRLLKDAGYRDVIIRYASGSGQLPVPDDLPTPVPTYDGK